MGDASSWVIILLRLFAITASPTKPLVRAEFPLFPSSRKRAEKNDKKTREFCK